MSRRFISPLKTPKRPQNDPRENIIRKLNEDLIVERGRDKELAILENHLLEIIDKTKLLTAEIVSNDLS
jgi:uncharacterized protein (DUF488 family)